MKVTLCASLAGVTTIAYLLRKMRFIRVDGFCSSIYWTTRSWIWNHPVPNGYHAWFGSGKREEFWQDRIMFVRSWGFLRPFFASHGYDLYVFKNPDDISEDLFPSPASAVSTSGEASFPYACCLYQDKMSTSFMFHSLRVWPARDKNGRDVVIKAISGPIHTTEFQSLRLLHSDALRNDPRNHTIPVLEYLYFDGLVFVVMPRWVNACAADFAKVGELVRFGQALFEAITFLHEHGIGHGDIALHNMSMDLILDDGPRLAGLRGPERKYALIDFETAQLFDVKSVIDQPPSIFKHDIFRLAIAAEIHLRCIEDVLPDLGPLFDAMKDIDNPSQPTAGAALGRYEEICNTLSPEDMERNVEATRWRHGRTTYRTGPPIYYNNDPVLPSTTSLVQ